MRIEEIFDSWNKDCKIDETELSRESLNTPSLHGKYLRMFSDERLKLRSLKLKQKQLAQTLVEYYKGDLNNPEDLKAVGRDPWPRKILRQDIQSYVDADREMVELIARVSYQEEVVEVLQEIVKSINNRGFSIKNSIDFLRFINGGK